MNRLLNFLVGYDPERDGRKQVHLPTKTDNQRIVAKGVSLPSNVTPKPRTGWLELFTTDENGIPSWQNLNAENTQTDTLERSPILTEEEIEYMTTTEGMKLDKGEELKVWWACGDSIQQCVDRYIGKWGYSFSTIKKYWALFNKASSPI